MMQIQIPKGRTIGEGQNGTIRVLMGSTEKMGTGLNVQDKLLALHNLDAPWRPADLTQRNGRILRQGNENEEVSISITLQKRPLMRTYGRS